MTASPILALAQAGQSSGKNYVVNGAMLISQENVTNAGTANGYYPADQWSAQFTNNGALSIAQVASSTPGGSPNKIRLTVTAPDGVVQAANYVFIQQKIEGYRVADLMFGSASAKSITLRFGVKAPAGTYCVALVNAALNRSFVAEYAIAAAEANTDVVRTLNLTADSVGTWVKDNGVGVEIRFALRAGSNFQQGANAWSAANGIGTRNQLNFLATPGNVFELFDVGFYKATPAPTFVVPDFADALWECQRYFDKSYPYSQAVGGLLGGGAAGYSGLGVQSGGSFQFLASTYAFKRQMRAAPNMRQWDNAGNLGKASWYNGGWQNGGAGTITAVSDTNFIGGVNQVGAQGFSFGMAADARM